MKELIRVRVEYASRQQCCKTHKRPLPLPFYQASQLKENEMGMAYAMNGPDGKCVQDFLVRKSEINRTDVRPRHRWKDIYYKS